MFYKNIDLKEFLCDYNLVTATETQIKDFKTNLNNFIESIKENNTKSEEFLKNELKGFLEKSFCYVCNVKDNIDLAIYEDRLVTCIFEVKSLNNTQEFPKINSLESKAFYESILYFLIEYYEENNNNIANIILTNTQDFYIINAKEYKIFLQNPNIKKIYTNCINNNGNNSSTKKFYHDLESILKQESGVIKYCHVKLDSIIDSDLGLLFALFSPFCLLKRTLYVDANILNERFYKELLHILGLKQDADAGVEKILPSNKENTLLDSICKCFGYDRSKDFENIFSLIMTWNNRILFLRLLESMLLDIRHIKKPFLDLNILPDFNALQSLFFDILAIKEDDRLTYNMTHICLDSMPYLNSSLFAKQPLEKEGKEIKNLESKEVEIYKDSILYQDVTFYKMLNLKKRKALPLLEYIFAFLHAYNFSITPNDIMNNINVNFNKLINSAVLGLVFEKLNGYKEGSFYTPGFITNYMCKEAIKKAILNKFNKAKNWSCKSIESLREKISENMDKIKANEIFNSIKLCDPSVGSGHFLVTSLNHLILLKFELGILCEYNSKHRLKDINLILINDEITIYDSHNNIFKYSYPSRENIESHIIQKTIFNEKKILIQSCLFGVDINPNSCEITKLRLWIELLKYTYYKDIEKKRLETLPNIDINIKHGNSLMYNVPLDDFSKFKEKLDNHSNESLNILTNKTYESYTKKLESLLKNYKQKCFVYYYAQGGQAWELKNELELISKEIKQLFFLTQKECIEFKKALFSYFQLYGWNGIYNAEILSQQDKINLSKLIFEFNMQNTFFEERKQDLQEKERYAINSKNLYEIYINYLKHKEDFELNKGFEWRYEFPKMLYFDNNTKDINILTKQITESASKDSIKKLKQERAALKQKNGDFLGFDIIIGNPPYMQVPKGIYNKDFFIYSEGKDKGKQNTYKVFIELGYNLGLEDSIISFVTQSSIMCDLSAKFTRELLLKETQINYIIEFKKNQKIFTNVTQGVCIIEFQKTKPKENQSFNISINNTESKMDKISFESIKQKDILKFFPLYEIPLIKKGEMPLISKIKNNKIMLKDMINKSLQGNINTIHLHRIKSDKPTEYKIIKGANIHRFYIDNNIMYAKITDETTKIIDFNQSQKFIIAMQGITGMSDKFRLHASFIESNNNFIFLHSTKLLFLSNENHAKLLTGLLNSTLFNWLFKITSTNNNVNIYELETLPIPKLDSNISQHLAKEIINIVEKMIESKNDNLGAALDSLIFQLYNLDSNDIKVIESS